MHIGFSPHVAHCTLIGRFGNTISTYEGGGYFPVPRLHLPVGLGRALRSAFFSAFFERGFDTPDDLNLVQNIQPRFDVTRFLNFPVLGIKRLNF